MAQKHMKKIKISGSLSLAVALLIIFLPNAANAGFNPGYIVSDFEYFNYQSMSVRGIQEFLDSQSGALKSMSFSTPNGTKSVAQIIYDAARLNRVSPKVILATLQKEQSLITNSSRAVDSVLRKAMGYGCPDSTGCDAQYYGFYNQVNRGSKLLGDDPVNGRASSFKVGSTYNIAYTYGSTDIQKVTVKNDSTALLYQYTPYRHGNELFYNNWTKWFKIKYPDGTLVRPDGEAGVSLISNGKRYGFYSRVAFVSRGYDFRSVVVMPRDQVLAYESAGGIDFPNFSIIEDKNGQRYFIDGLEKLPIPSDKIFLQLGFLEEEVLKYNTMNKYQKLAVDTLTTGDPLKSPEVTSYPTGVLLQNIETGAIGYVKDSVMHMLHSKEVLYNQFPNQTWVRVSKNEFNSFTVGSPIKLRDGTLVRSPKYGGGVFIISNGLRRPVTSREVFDGLGFKMENVIKTNDRTLELHPSGPPFDAPNQ